MGKKFAKETVEKWNELYKAGHTLEQIGTAFSTSGKTVSKHIKNLENSVKPGNGILHSASTENSAISSSGSSHTDDAEIAKLQRQLEIAKLKRQIREVESPLETEARLGQIQKKLSDHDNQFSKAAEWIEWFDESIESLEQNLAIRVANYQCSCGGQGQISFYIRCKNCYGEFWFG